MTFSADWTHGRVDLWTPYLQHLVGRENVNALEIGCYEGRSTVWMLENILTHPTSRIVCVDPFLGGSVPDLPNEYLTAFVANTLPYQKQVRIVQAKSREVSAETLLRFAPGYDLIYIDASHLPDETVLEARLAWSVANQGAVIIFDDYSGGLKEAVQAWIPKAPEILQNGDVQLIIKKV
jgi:predicted O-methyltransferase YrrM